MQCVFFSRCYLSLPRGIKHRPVEVSTVLVGAVGTHVVWLQGRRFDQIQLSERKVWYEDNNIWGSTVNESNFTQVYEPHNRLQRVRFCNIHGGKCDAHVVLNIDSINVCDMCACSLLSRQHLNENWIFGYIHIYIYIYICKTYIYIHWYIAPRQITIIPKPELRGSLGDSLTKPSKVTSAEVAIICPDPSISGCLGVNFHWGPT